MSPYLVLVLSGAAALQPPSRSAPLPSPIGSVSRRAALAALPLAFAAPAQRAAAICSCPKGFDSCVCTDEKSDASVVTIQKKRADAAGRDAAQSRREVLMLRSEDQLTSDEQATTRARDQAKAKQQQLKVSAGASDPRDMIIARGGLTGGGSQNYGDINVMEAKRRFQDIVVDTVLKREAEYGFELDANDIKQIESVLRVKYCGKEGLIGPC